MPKRKPYQNSNESDIAIAENQQDDSTTSLLRDDDSNSFHPVQTIIHETIRELAELDQPHSLGYKIGEGVSVVIVGISTIPLYGISSWNFAFGEFAASLPAVLPRAARMLFILLTPTGSVVVNVGQNALGMFGTWDGLAKILTDKKSSVGAKILKTSAATIGCLPASSASIAAAIAEQYSSNIFKWGTVGGTVISTIPFNLYSTLISFQSNLPRLFLRIKDVFSGESARWQETLTLRNLLRNMILAQCKKLSLNTQALRFLREANLLNAILPEGVMTKQNLNDNFNKSNKPFFQRVSGFFSELSVKKVFQKTVQTTLQIFAAGVLDASWIGYQCALEKFWEPIIGYFEPEAASTASWVPAFISMLPLYYVSAQFGWDAMKDLCERIIFRQPDVEKPYCLRHYQGLTLGLVTGLTILSAFTFPLSKTLVDTSCPVELQAPGAWVSYIGTPFFNLMVCLKLMNSKMKEYTLDKQPDAKLAEQVIAFLEAIANKIENMPPREFAESVQADKVGLFVVGLAKAMSSPPDSPELDGLKKLIKGSEMELQLDKHYRGEEATEKENESRVPAGGVPTPFMTIGSYS